MFLFLVYIRVERGRNVVATMYQFALTSVHEVVCTLSPCVTTYTHTQCISTAHTHHIGDMNVYLWVYYAVHINTSVEW